MIDPWERVRAGRPTAVVGGVPPAPDDLEIVRGRCGPGLAGLDAVAAQLGLPSDTPVRLVREPLAHRLVRDLEPPGPAAGVLRALASLRGRAAVVLTRVERASADAEAVLRDWIGSGDEIPLLLVAEREDAGLLEALRDRYGSGAVLALGAPQAPLAALPTDVLHVLCAAAALGTRVRLPDLAAATGRTEDAVLAALQGASVRGIRLQDDGTGTFELDPDLEEELRAATLPSLAARVGAVPGARQAIPRGALADARTAVAVGAWEAARRQFALAGPEGRLEHAAVCWALGDGLAARALLDPPADVAEREALLGLMWGERDISASLGWCDDLPEPRRTLDRAALFARAGRLADARVALEGVLATLGPAERATALHLLARLPLLEPGPSPEDVVLDARRHVRSALEVDPGDDERARLLETAARLALRAGEREAAAVRYQEAIPLLDQTRQPLALARAVAGLAVCAGSQQDGRPVRELVGAAEVLGALDRAVRLNRARPHGLAWCKIALQGLMERVDVSARTSLLSDLRRVSLEIAALQAQFRHTPRVEPL